MSAIGGYFELELNQGEHYHKNAIRLNTARNCLEYILKVRGYTKIYIPYYTCEVILEPVKRCNVEYEFYSVNMDLEPQKNILLNKNEAFLYTNYFGLKQNCVEKLALIYGKNLIVDNSQAFFELPFNNIDTFYSARKFFGVSDGAYLYTDTLLSEKLKFDISYDRVEHLLKRIELSAEEAFIDFKHNDAILNNQPILKMSKLTEKILKSINYQFVIEQRKCNFQYLHSILHYTNKLKITFDEKKMIPMVYPYLIEDGNLLKSKLIEEKIFTPTYWSNVFQWAKYESCEYLLAKKMVFLPIDQRYNINQMKTFIKNILK